MTEDQIEERRMTDVVIRGIPEEDWFYFKDIIKIFEGDRVVAFRALLDCYNREQMFGEVFTKLQRIEQRIEDLEHTKRVETAKTFGGGLK